MDAVDAPAQQIGPIAIDLFFTLPLILNALLDFMSPRRHLAPFGKPFHDFILAIANRLIGQFVKWWTFSRAS
jgi:hypothetical protein